MSKSKSPFDALRIARPLAKQPDGQTVSRSTVQMSEPAVAKSRDPGFVKFTTYIRRQTHLEAKTLALRQGRELSEIVEDLLASWVRGHQP